MSSHKAKYDDNSPNEESGRPILINMRVEKIVTHKDGTHTVTCKSKTTGHRLDLKMDTCLPFKGDYVTVNLHWRKLRSDSGVRYTDPSTWKDKKC